MRFVSASSNVTSVLVTVDFREAYAAVIDGWLGGSHGGILPGGPFSPLPLFV